MMAKFAKYEIVSGIVDAGLIPIFYQKDLEVSKFATAAGCLKHLFRETRIWSQSPKLSRC